MMSVLTNLSAMGAMRANRNATRSLQDSFRKLSSGFRVERAADDAAGLAVSENLDARAMSQRVAKRNTNDGISVVQTAEGALNEVADMMKRMRELAVQSSSETLASTELAYVNDEFKQLQTEIGRIKEVTEFNGTKLLDGTISGGMNVQVGANNTVNDRIAITAGNVAAAAGAILNGTAVNGGATPTKGSLGPVGGPGIFIPPTKADGISAGPGQLNSAIARAAAINSGTAKHGVTATVGAAVYSPPKAVRAATGAPGDVVKFNGGASGSVNIDFEGVVIEDADATGTVQSTMQTALDAAYGSGTFEVDTSSGSLNITAADGRSFGFQAASPAIGAALGTGKGGMASGTLKLSSAEAFDYSFAGTDWGFTPSSGTVAESDISSQATVSVETVSLAREAIGIMDRSLDFVNGQRSKLGAVENRLGSALNLLETDTESLMAAKSQIRDVDFARETANMAKAQIMQQSSTAILAQANQLPQMALRLI